VKWKALLAFAAAGIVALACCGCSSPARPPRFDAMLPDSNNLTAVLGPVTGTGSRMLTVPASRSMSLTVACIGKGIVEVRGLLSGAELCKGASIGRGAFGGWYWAHLEVRPGEHIKLRVVADARTVWDIRVDGLPRRCKSDVCTS
jgi:hypothetical protein